MEQQTFATLLNYNHIYKKMSLGTQLIEPSIEKTKKILFPFNIIIWLKIAVFVIFVEGMSFKFNVNLGDSEKGIIEFLTMYWEIVALIAILSMIVGIIYLFFSSVLRFCFFDSITTKKVLLLGYFRKNLKKGTSLFILQLIVGGLFLLLSAALAYPVIRTFISNMDNLSMGLFNIKYIIFAVVTIALLSILCWVFVNLLTVYFMYVSDRTAWPALKGAIRLCGREWKEVAIFLLLNLALGILAGIVTVILMFIMVLILLLGGAILFGIGFILYKVAAALLIPLIVIGVIIAIAAAIVFVIAMLMVMVPFTTFFAYYRLDFMRGLVNK